MKKISILIEMYKNDAYHFDDFNDDNITELLNKLEESLSSLKEKNISSYITQINEFKNSLQNNEEKEILNDFLTYCKYFNK